jgi:hypothetical protein
VVAVMMREVAACGTSCSMLENCTDSSGCTCAIVCLKLYKTGIKVDLTFFRNLSRVCLNDTAGWITVRIGSFFIACPGYLLEIFNIWNMLAL